MRDDVCTHGNWSSMCHQCLPQKEIAPLDTQVGGNHYKNMNIQPVVFCHANNMGGIESAVVKYVSRHKFKNGKQDIEKAIHLLNILIQLEYPG